MEDIEDIPDLHCVYVRVHLNFVSSKDSKPKATAFSNTPKDGDNLSCDWCKYSSAESSRKLIGSQKKKDGSFKDSSDFYIWKFNVAKLRIDAVPKQNVKHDPVCNTPPDEFIPNNIAHSIIIGDKPINNAEFRISLLKIGQWAIAP